MSIAAVSGSNPYPIQSTLAKSRKDFQALANDLSSGNLAGAQKDVASFQEDFLSLLQSSKSQTATPPAGLQQATADLQTLQADLKSGNLAGAQKDFAALQQDLQGIGGHHKGHRHHQQDGATSSSTATNGTGAGVPSAMLAAYASQTQGSQNSTINIAA